MCGKTGFEGHTPRALLLSLSDRQAEPEVGCMHPLVRVPGGAHSEALLCTRNVWCLWPEADVDPTVLMEPAPEKGSIPSPGLYFAFQLAPLRLFLISKITNHSAQLQGLGPELLFC